MLCGSEMWVHRLVRGIVNVNVMAAAPHPLGHGGEDVRSQGGTECGVLHSVGILKAVENEKVVQQRWGTG